MCKEIWESSVFHGNIWKKFVGKLILEEKKGLLYIKKK